MAATIILGIARNIVVNTFYPNSILQALNSGEIEGEREKNRAIPPSFIRKIFDELRAVLVRL